jgi:uncharacterized delta-60 repeat protein
MVVGRRFRVGSILGLLTGAAVLAVACGGDDEGGPAACPDCDGGAFSETSTRDGSKPEPDGSAPLQDGGTDGDADADAAVTINCGEAGPPGSLDTTFGDGGLVWLKYAGSSAYAVAVQADGKIVVGGKTATAGGSFAVVRLLSDGSLDTTFGTGGLVERRLGNVTNVVMALAVQPDGRILAAGWVADTSGPNKSYDFAVLRFLSNGGVDSSFGSGGAILTDFAGRGDYAKSILALPDGRIVVAGASEQATSSTSNFTAARYNADGSLDSTFGAAGKVLVDLRGTVDSPGAAALLPGGRLAVGGASGETTSVVTPSDISAAVLGADGGLDTTFGDGGTFVATSSASAFAIASDGAGKLLLAGTTGSDFVLVRLTSSGVLDSTFGSAGTVTTDFGANEEAAAVLVQDDGRIIVAGQSDPGSGQRAVALARYSTVGTLDPSFGSAGKVLTVALANEYYGTNGAALLGCGVVTAGAWNYGPSGFMQAAMGVAKYRR